MADGTAENCNEVSSPLKLYQILPSLLQRASVPSRPRRNRTRGKEKLKYIEKWNINKTRKGMLLFPFLFETKQRDRLQIALKECVCI